MSNKQYIAIIGIDGDKKPRGAKFDLADTERVRKASQLMELEIASAKTDEQNSLMAKLPDGKLFASGFGLVPLIKKPLYDLLSQKLEVDTAPKTEPQKQSGQPAKPAPALPQVWQELKLGSVVLCQDESKKPAWWECVVVGISKDGEMLTLRWQKYPAFDPFPIKRNAVAILPPSSK